MLQEASAKRILQVATTFNRRIHQVCEREELRFRASAECSCHERVEANQNGMEGGRIIMKGPVGRAALRENPEQLLQELLGTLWNLSHFSHNGFSAKASRLFFLGLSVPFLLNCS